MKYRTIIELVCEAEDKDAATHIAGDYLKGDMDFGVEMHCKTESVWGHKIGKYAASSAVALIVLGSFILGGMPVQVDVQTPARSRVSLTTTSTVMPELKTQNGEEFRHEWEQKKDDAILDYLKN